MARFGICANCGRRVRGNYVRCYRCNARRRRSSWHDAEHIDGLEERDAELGRTNFYVYVLATGYGHYVGHTANVRARLGAHVGDRVESTSGGEPKLLWTSYPFSTRREAAEFEAAMKSLRDQRSKRFHEITGFEPVPFVTLYAKANARHSDLRGRRPRVHRRQRPGVDAPYSDWSVGPGLRALIVTVIITAILIIGFAYC